MYASETASSEKRGRLVSIKDVFALSGLALASWVNFGMLHASGAVTCRFPWPCSSSSSSSFSPSPPSSPNRLAGQLKKRREWKKPPSYKQHSDTPVVLRASSPLVCKRVSRALGGLTTIFVADKSGRGILMFFLTACMILAHAAVRRRAIV